MGGNKFQPREFPQSGSKAIDVERVKRREERKSMIAMVNTSCLNQKIKKSVKTMANFASTEAAWTN